MDFIRLLGKFGDNLAGTPSSIFKHIPPFCPRDSIISQFAGRQENPLIKVAGISSRTWDDNLAKLSVGQDETASEVRCNGAYFLALVSSSGTVIVWSAETCEELRRLEHGEWVVLFETNATGSMVVTSGRFTFKIWDVSTGQLLHFFGRDPGLRPVQLAFGSGDTDLVVAYDHCYVVWYDTQTGTEVERFNATEQSDKLRGCPRLMALSLDQSQVAIAFRGRPVFVWETNDASPNPPRRCIRAVNEQVRSNETDAYSAPEAAVWHPDGDSRFILYQDTVLVHWNLIEDERSEYDKTGAREMVINSDGTLLLTSNYGGVLSVWALPRFNLVYRLQVQGSDFVRDMAFSPDSQRIYDARGSMCCVWEPDALVRPDDIDRQADNVSSTADCSSASEAPSEPVYSQDGGGSEVTALTYERGGEFYCCGRGDGTVSIHDMIKGKIARKVCTHGSNADVVSLAWSASGRYLVSGDDMGKVIAKRLRLKEDGRWAVFPVFETQMADAFADQFLFSPDEKLLLISTPSRDEIWDLAAKTLVCGRTRGGEVDGQWINHPSDDTRLLFIDQHRVHIHEWRNFTNAVIHTIVTTEPADPMDESTPRPRENTSSDKVEALSAASNLRFLVCQTSPEPWKTRSRANRDKRAINVLLAADLRTPAPTQEQVRHRLLPNISACAQRFLGCYRDKVVFIDHENWYVLSSSLRDRFQLCFYWFNGWP